MGSAKHKSRKEVKAAAAEAAATASPPPSPTKPSSSSDGTSQREQQQQQQLQLQQQQQQQAAIAAAAPPPRPLTLKERLLPEGGLLPWWVVLIFSVYALLKLGLTLEHPCGVLGTYSPVTRAQIQRTYRQLSVCTHPDKLVGAAPEDIRRGELLFKRASKARDDLLQLERAAKEAEEHTFKLLKKRWVLEGGEPDAFVAPESTAGATCSPMIDQAIYQGIMYVFGYLLDMGAYEIFAAFFGFLWSLVTFEFDIQMTISYALLLLTAFRGVEQLVRWAAATGPLTMVVAAVTTVVVGPIPTILRFLCLPFLRLVTFAKMEALPFLKGHGEGSKDDASADDSASGEASGVDGEEDDGAAAEGGEPQGLATGAAAATAAAAAPGADAPTTAAAVGPVGPSAAPMPKRGMKQRGRPMTRAELEEEREALLRGEGKLARGGGGPNGLGGGFGAAPPPPLSSLSLVEVLQRKPLPHARMEAAAAMQFDLFLSTTKYVIPLVALVSTGQVFNGLWSSMATAQMLHRIPPMRPELHHVLLVLVGFGHTLLCAGKSQLAELQAAPEGLLQLQWQWSIRDVLAVANVMALGATFSSASNAGNEPPFCASFAAGVALRMLFYEAMPTMVSGGLASFMRQNAQLELIGVDEVAVRAGRGVGTCSGGPVRFLLGWLEAPSTMTPATLLAKASLLCLPCLAALQWLLRAIALAQRLQREKERDNGTSRKLRSGELLVPVLWRRLLLSCTVLLSLCVCVAYFALFELNAVGSSLGNLLIIALAGCHFESLLSTYDVRGRLRSAVFFVMFMVL